MPVSGPSSVDHRELVVRAQRAVEALGASTCNCPYETERELAAEVERLRKVAIEHGACSCVWDVNEDWQREGDPDDVIVKPAPACAVHGNAS